MPPLQPRHSIESMRCCCRHKSQSRSRPCDARLNELTVKSEWDETERERNDSNRCLLQWLACLANLYILRFMYNILEFHLCPLAEAWPLASCLHIYIFTIIIQTVFKQQDIIWNRAAKWSSKMRAFDLLSSDVIAFTENGPIRSMSGWWFLG